MSLTKVSYSMLSGAPVNVVDKGADNTGATDCSAAVLSAITEANGTRDIYFPSGTYKFSVTITNPALATRFYGNYAGSILKPLSAAAPCFVLQYNGTGGGNWLQFKFERLNFTDTASKTSCAIWTLFNIQVNECQFNNLKYGVLGNSNEWSRFDKCYFNGCQFDVYATAASAANDPLGFGSTALINPSEWYFTNCWFQASNCAYFEEQLDNPYQKDNYVIFTSCNFMGVFDTCVAISGAQNGGVTFIKCWWEGRFGTEPGITVRSFSYPSAIIYTSGTSVTMIDCREMTEPNPVYVYAGALQPVDYPIQLKMSGTDINGDFAIWISDNTIASIRDCRAYKNGGYSLNKFNFVENVVPTAPTTNSGIVFRSTVWPLVQVQGSATGPYTNRWTKGTCAGATSNIVGTPTVAITTGDGFISNKYLAVTACADGDGLHSGNFTSVDSKIYIMTFTLRNSSGFARSFRVDSFGFANGVSSPGTFVVGADSQWHNYSVVVGCSAGAGGAAGGMTLRNYSGTAIAFDVSAIQVVQFDNIPQAVQYLQSGIYTLPVVL